MFIVRAAAVHRLLLNSRGKLKAHHYPPCPRRAASRFESSISVNSIYPGTGKDAIAKAPAAPAAAAVRRQAPAAPAADAVRRQAPAAPAAAASESEFSGIIPVKSLTITYCHAPGPGGQNVNKSATKVDMRFHLDSADWLSSPVREKVRKKFGNQLTKGGFFVVLSDRTRSRTLNQAECMQKIRDAVRSALLPEKPPIDGELEERIRKGNLRAARERLKEKRVLRTFERPSTVT